MSNIAEMCIVKVLTALYIELLVIMLKSTSRNAMVLNSQGKQISGISNFNLLLILQNVILQNKFLEIVKYFGLHANL